MARAATMALRAPPLLRAYRRWEYCEHVEDLGVKTLYDEVGDLMSYMRTIREEVRKLNTQFKSFVSVAADQSKVTTGMNNQASKDSGGNSLLEKRLAEALAEMET